MRNVQNVLEAPCTECARRQTRVPLATLYRTEQGTNGHILLSVHGFAIISYLLASTASKAAIGRRHVVQLRPRWRTRSWHVGQCWSRRPSGRAGLTPLSAGRQGMARGVMQGDSWRGVRSGRFVSCHGVGARHFYGSWSPCQKWNVAAPGLDGRKQPHFTSSKVTPSCKK